MHGEKQTMFNAKPVQFGILQPLTNSIKYPRADPASMVDHTFLHKPLRRSKSGYLLDIPFYLGFEFVIVAIVCSHDTKLPYGD